MKWSIRWALVSALLVMMFATGLPVLADTATDDYNLAVSLYKQNRWKEAGDEFRKFIDAFPAHEKVPFAKLYRGLSLISLDEFEPARKELRDFVAKYPQNQNVGHALYRIGECSYLLDDWAAARTDLQAFLDKDPNNSLAERALPYLGDVQLRQGDYAAAAESYRQAIKLYPNGFLLDDTQFGLAKALEGAGQKDEAIRAYETIAIETRHSRAADALFQLATLAFESKDFPLAAKRYLDLGQRFPKSPLVGAAHMNAGYALYHSKQFTEAAEQFRMVPAESEQSLEAGYWLGMSLKSEGRPKEAATAFTQILERAADRPLAETLLYQAAGSQRQAGLLAEATVNYERLLEKFPQGDLADDSQHALADMAVEAGDSTLAQQRIGAFAAKFPESGLRLYQRLLVGRLHLADAARTVPPNADQLNQAGEVFSKVLSESTIPRTQAQAQYYLSVVKQLARDFPAAIEAARPLAEKSLAEGGGEFADAVMVLAESLLGAKDFAGAANMAREYQSKIRPVALEGRAMTVEAVAAAETQDWATAEKVLARLEPTAAQRIPLTAQLAEAAERQSAWPTAEKYFGQLVTLTDRTPQQVYALRGLAWAAYKQDRFELAAGQFAKVIEGFPSHALAAEALYYQADSLQLLGQADGAAPLFEAAFKQLAPASPPVAGAEREPPVIYAYRAGLQAARIYKQQGKIADADRLYEQVVNAFPKAQSLDRLFDEWALVNFEAERFDRSDEIFQRLIAETPQSDLVDNARLALAESNLVNDRRAEAAAEFQQLAQSATSDDDVKERAHYQLMTVAASSANWAQLRQAAAGYLAAFPAGANAEYAECCQAEAKLLDAPTNGATTDWAALKDQLVTLKAKLAASTLKPRAWEGRVWVLLAEVFFRLKQYDDVVATSRDLEVREPGSSYLYQAYEVEGRSLKQQAKFDEARGAFTKVVESQDAYRTETAAKSQFLLAETFLQQERWNDAFRAYQKVYASYNFPEWQAPALLQSGKCDEQLGRLKEAAASYERLVDQFGASPYAAEAQTRLDDVRLRLKK